MIRKFTFNNQYIFNELPQSDKELFEKVMHNQKYHKSQAVFTQESIPSRMFFVKEGKVKKFKVDAEGREQIIYIYNAGEFFGYSALLSDETYSTSTTAIEDSTISFIYKEDFFRILDNSTSFSRLLLKSLSHEFRVTTNLMAVLSQRTVRERVALCLLILHNKYKVSEGKEISISRLDLANMVGTVIETLARILHDLRNENLIALEGKKIKITNTEGLEAISNYY
ncbi:Crp/Fnr family transcriptional regulator [Reichenbachiella agarivorans]|uniref:Crp/Fnr family transcriptional regulator n=1 Tax=Reichenbachiella agarivorans TaxID=2979464 RepID=A0ABY6CLL7_9BACT|nr:Crp/Fnr family transcriptional regulator [Reichenbachiella agarivorans]UXP31417.1 Crp/Fnr family transcriptional regulator [Reichenbachiella agarivorans]